MKVLFWKKNPLIYMLHKYLYGLKQFPRQWHKLLGAWTLWRHHNDCVFNGVGPSISSIMIMSGIEINSWEMIGSRVYRCLVLVSGHMVLSIGSFSVLLLLSTLLEFPSCNSVAAFFGLMYYVHSSYINIMICGSHAYSRQKMGDTSDMIILCCLMVLSALIRIALFI